MPIASAAAVVVLPTPPEPAQMTIRLSRTSSSTCMRRPYPGTTCDTDRPMPALRLTDRELAVAVALVEAPGYRAARSSGRAEDAPRGAAPRRRRRRRRHARARCRRHVARRRTGDRTRRAAPLVRRRRRRAARLGRRARGGDRPGRGRRGRAAPRAARGASARARARRGPRRRPGPEDHDARAPLPVSAAALLAARDDLRTGDRTAAAEQLRGAQDVDAALAIADTIRHAFVAQGSWREPDGEWHTGTVAALDAGPAGWWSFVRAQPTARSSRPTRMRCPRAWFGCCPSDFTVPS